MNKCVRHLALLCLAATAFSAAAQGEPPAPPPGYGYPGQMQRPMRPQHDWRDASPDQREQWREERRQRRDAWRELSPEERHQLRRDIRDAGRMYRRGQRD